jgi:uncharacterized protein (UPF0276 family)
MIRVGTSFRAGLIPWLWDAGDLVQILEHSLDAFVVAGSDDGLRSARTCAEMGEFTLHSIGLTLGSPDARARPQHLVEIRAVLDAMGTDELSDHLAYSRLDGRRLQDFAPLWRVEEQLDLLCGNVDFVQDKLGARLVLENVACLFDPGGDMSTSEFANEVSRRTGARLLLDISNVLINEANGFCVAADEFAQLDLDAVAGVHLAGGEMSDGLMFDAHSSPVPLSDIDWLARLLPDMPNCTSVIIERDENLQQGYELVEDLRRVSAVVERVALAQSEA